MTSFAFMFVCVPLPVCQTNSGKWSSSLPSMTSSAARDDQIDLVLRQRAELAVGQRGGLLEHAERADHRPGKVLPADAEVMQRSLGLGAPVAVRGDRDLAHAV